MTRRINIYKASVGKGLSPLQGILVVKFLIFSLGIYDNPLVPELMLLTKTYSFVRMISVFNY
jgi:hypothetical protein